jgi:hypothetical protein
MGLFKRPSWSTYDAPKQDNPNPDPTKYKILWTKALGDFLVVLIKYPNCPTYEGEKLLVFKNPPADLLTRGRIDPHFSSKTPEYSPIARFRPTEEGVADSAFFVATKQMVGKKEENK